MGKLISLVFSVFIFLSLLNVIFFYESFVNEDLREFYLGGSLSDEYSSDEKEHMEEVKTLGLFSLLLNLVLLFFVFRYFEYVNLKKSSFYLFVIFGLLILCGLFFDRFFEQFHLMFFDSVWKLPSSSKLIQDYPFEFFRNRFLLLNFLVICSAVVSWGIVLKRFPKKPQRN